MVPDWDPALTQLRELYGNIDHEARRLGDAHRERLQCRKGCSSCCVDDINVFEVEAAHIRRHHTELLAHGEPHEVGMCAFLDGAGGCRIYDSRPYVCRNQGLPLRWLDQDESGEWVELRDICVLNELAPPIAELSADLCWELGWVEGRLAAIQDEVDEGKLRRIALRDLFDAEPAGQENS
ncbi:MAG: YkgJ family cysteine cluster protein [Candidatus Latescibacterota bacterium]|nr:YkgJ family cysteine cluster protein [Candidatus Latescibacterota bacterium]